MATVDEAACSHETTQPGCALSGIEEEVVLLKATKELIDTMLNYEVLDLIGTDPDSSIRFKSITHQRFFNIVLVDFLSQTDKKAIVRQTSFLGAINSICDDPCFEEDGSVASLSEAANEFSDWLNREVEIDAWLPSIDTQTTLRLQRIVFLKISGNIAKHNLLRSAGVAQELRSVLDRSGVMVGLDEALLVLTDFYDRLHTDILNYHGNTLAEFLNNLRWGIYRYLQPEFRRSIVWESTDPPKYRYTYPTGVESAFAKECYWELMNEVRSAPCMRRFEATKYTKLRY